MKKVNLLIALVVLATSFTSFAIENAGDACLSNDGGRGEVSAGSGAVANPAGSQDASDQ